MNAAIVAIVWFGGIRVNAGGMSTGEVIAFINYVNMILLALMVVSNLVITFTKAYTSAGRVAEVLATQPAVSDSQHLVENPSSKAPAVAFSHVYFSYNDNQNDQYDLTDIIAVIPKGATVGVIGGTGAGKSTLMNLIMRFFDVQSGEVQVDGINVTHYPMETLRSKIGLVPQKSELFSATIAQNIRWGKPDASDQEVRNAAAAAQALEFIERQPDGFDAMVERGGANLSGGQKQRLSIARALVRRPEILILDDASSALDYATDAALRRSIRAMSKAREMTIFMVSQRVGTIQHADMILVMDDGYLKGVGTHQQLLASCEVYREICSVQLS
jgi:ATP-binding cassette subfamily B protein